MDNVYVQFGNGTVVTYAYDVAAEEDALRVTFQSKDGACRLVISLPSYTILEHHGFVEKDVKLFLRFTEANAPFIWEAARAGAHVTVEAIKQAVLNVVSLYPIRKVILFGSHADGTNTMASDIDLIIEFMPGAVVSLLTMAGIKSKLEELLHVPVDIIHGPVRDEDKLRIRHDVVLYVA